MNNQTKQNVLFISGIDTNVGKTVATGMIAKALAKAGKKDGCLIEGMGCPGGCVAGAGTNIPVVKGAQAVRKFVKDSTKPLPPKEYSEIELP